MTGDMYRTGTDSTQWLREPASARWASWLGLPAAGIGILLLLKVATVWLLTLPWVPFKGPLKLVASIPAPWAVLIAVVVGGVAGGVFAGMWDADRLSVRVHRELAELNRGRRVTQVRREAVSGVFLDRKELVVVCESGEERVREAVGMVPAAGLLAAFRANDWPVLDADPYAAEFQLWVAEDPRLPPGADVLLRDRKRMLEKSIFGQDDAKRLRGELARIGVFVRDDGKRQYWRQAAQGG